MFVLLNIFFIIFIGLIFFAIFSKGLLKSKIQYKVKYRLISCYLVVLTGIALIYITMIQPNMSNALHQSVDVPFLYDIIYENEDEIGELPDEYIHKKWELSDEIEELTLTIGDGSYDDHFIVDVIVDYHKDHTGKAILYETPTTISGIDISDYVPLKDFDVNGDSIIVKGEHYVEVDFLAISNEMTLSQFNKEPNGLSYNYFDFHNGEQILYLELPENVEINADEEYFYLIYK